MTVWGRIGVLSLGLLALRTTAAAAPANMTGAWELNVVKSRWGTVPMPSNTRVHVEHREPKLKYSGMVNYGSESMREFTFEGAIDGKAYPQSRSYGEGTVMLKRINDFTIESVWKSSDGLLSEAVRITLSADGKTMNRRHLVNAPDGTQDWNEVFEKK